MTTISWLKGFLWTDYRPKKKEEVSKTLINGMYIGFNLRLNQLESITIEGVTYDIKLKESTSLDLAKRKDE